MSHCSKSEHLSLAILWLEVQNTESREVKGFLQGHTANGRGRISIQTVWLQSPLTPRTSIWGSGEEWNHCGSRRTRRRRNKGSSLPTRLTTPPAEQSGTVILSASLPVKRVATAAAAAAAAGSCGAWSSFKAGLSLFFWEPQAPALLPPPSNSYPDSPQE